MTPIRQAPFALRIVQRKDGNAAILYRRKPNADANDRLQRIGALSPLVYTIAMPLLREGIARSADCERPMLRTSLNRLCTGAYYPLNADWGAKIACFAILAAGLRDAERLIKALGHLRHANPDEAAWWFRLLMREDNVRALRALRILTEAVE